MTLSTLTVNNKKITYRQISETETRSLIKSDSGCKSKSGKCKYEENSILIYNDATFFNASSGYTNINYVITYKARYTILCNKIQIIYGVAINSQDGSINVSLLYVCKLKMFVYSDILDIVYGFTAYKYPDNPVLSILLPSIQNPAKNTINRPKLLRELARIPNHFTIENYEHYYITNTKKNSKNYEQIYKFMYYRLINYMCDVLSELRDNLYDKCTEDDDITYEYIDKYIDLFFTYHTIIVSDKASWDLKTTSIFRFLEYNKLESDKINPKGYYNVIHEKIKNILN